MNSSFPFLLFAAAAIPVLTAGAGVTVPGFSGFRRLALLGNSDSYLSTPFARPPAATALIGSVAGGTVTVSGINPWQPGRFVNQGGPEEETYYLLIVSGSSAGSWFMITGSTAVTLTVDLDGDTLNAAANDRIAVIPCWTLGTLFPRGLGVHGSPSPSEIRTEIVLPDFNAATLAGGVPKVFSCIGGDWVEVAEPLIPRNHQAILPDSFFIVRHRIPAGTEFLTQGAVISSRLRSALGVNPASKRDNFLGLQRPTPYTLAASGLVSSGAFAASPTPGNRTDELFVYDNALVKLNKSASATYFYWNNAWRKVGSGTANFDNAMVFTPGTGFIIRKNASSTPPFWLNSPNY